MANKVTIYKCVFVHIYIYAGQTACGKSIYVQCTYIYNIYIASYCIYNYCCFISSAGQVKVKLRYTAPVIFLQ